MKQAITTKGRIKRKVNKMNNEMSIFENEEFGSLRAVEIDGNTWFVGKDVAKALGYSNTKDAISTHVDNEDKSIFQRSDFATLENYIPKDAFPVKFVPADIPNRGLTFINESGLYSLILSSKLPTAKKFKRWVTSEILPSIRKHGAYVTPETMDNIISNPDFGIKLLEALKDEREKNEQLSEDNKRMRPKEKYFDAVVASKDKIQVREFARMLSSTPSFDGKKHRIGANRLFEFLRMKKFVVKQKGKSYNEPTQYAIEKGLFVAQRNNYYNKRTGKIDFQITAYLTPKGQQYFINYFYKHPEVLNEIESIKFAA